MKKLLFSLFSGILIILAFASCNKYEESMYNKNDMKIQYVWYKSNVGAPNETFVYDKKKMLTEITIIDSANIGGIRSEKFEFTYNKDKTVKSITHDNGEITETVSFSYLNRYVKYMTYSMNGEVRLTSNFFRDDEKAAKITRIVEIYDRTFFEDNQLYNKAALFNKFLRNQATLDVMASANTKELTFYSEKIITYEGENIIKIEESYPDIHKSISTEQTFSDVLNPYYGMNYCYFNNLFGFSKNMPTRTTVNTYYDGTLTKAEITEYQFPKVNKYNYPRIFTYSTERDPGVSFKTYITYASEYKD